GHARDWCRVAAKLPGRTNKDCRKRWHNSIAGGLKKGQWSKSEDRQLAKGVEQYGQRWTLVADVVHSRSADQCAKRWQQSLDPDLDHSEWCESDDKLLIDAVQRHGRHWKDIQSEHFQGRSKNCIKNRYTVLVRKFHKGIELAQSANTSRSSVSSHIQNPNDNTLPVPGMDDGFLSFYAQVHTPDWEDGCSIEGDASPSVWDTPPPMNIGHPPVEYSNPYTLPTTTGFDDAPWSWTSLPMDQTTLIPDSSPNSYAHSPNAYDPYATLTGIPTADLNYHHHGPWDAHALGSSPSVAPVVFAQPGSQGSVQYTNQGQRPQRDHPYRY
ncbi:hypothetical protein DM02DRAFT_528409, partial [Periconia macrospinosa]